MIYDVSLTITYDYQTPAASGRHSLRLLPATVDGEQRLVAGAQELVPKPDERVDWVDFFGNAVTDVAYRSPHTSIVFKMTGRVDRSGSSLGFDVSPLLPMLKDELEDVRALDALQPIHFTGESPRIVTHEEMTAYARDMVSDDMTVLSAVETIGSALNRDLTFDSNATDVDTPPLDAFRNRHGVCQDFTHIMIACLRGIGIPAGYVSGFLRTIPPEGSERLEGADAMHAWVRAWCGFDLGWVEYDPTNALRVGQDHIVVAYGRDYSDIAPVKGVLRTSGDQVTSQGVDVIPRPT